MGDRWLGRKRWVAAGAASLAVLALACGPSGKADQGAGPPGGESPAALRVVASTDVYGDIAKHIAGDRATITSIIDDPAADPHSYQANTRTQLELSKADVVIRNGGGYDDFVDTMLSAAGNDHATVLNVVDISGKTAPPGGELNEHVWYDLPTVATLADRVAGALSRADPADASTFAANAAYFRAKLHALESVEADIKAAHSGDGVAITEPVPLYLLQACGLDNKTPEEFSEAVEEGTDVSPVALKETLDLFADHQVALVVYNEQTSGPETEKVLDAAKANGVPVVPVTETLPAGQDYLTWMSGNLAKIRSALGSR